MKGNRQPKIKENKTNRRIAFSEREMEMVNELKDEMGTKSISRVIHTALLDYYRSYFPAYRTKNTNTTLTAEAMEKRAKNKVIMKDLEDKAKEEIRLQPRVDSCINDFKGRVEDGMCYFTSHQPEAQYDQEESIPLESCFEDIAEARVWLPSRQAVYNKRPELVEKLKVNKKN